MSFLSYTIFADAACTQVRQVANLSGDKAEQALRIFQNLKGSTPRECDVIAGCRIDRIGSEDIAEAA
jgi:hypothetical protein